MRRLLSIFTLLAVLLPLAGAVQAGPLAQSPATALVHVTIASDQDLAAFRATGLPAYSRQAGYLLAGADAAGQEQLRRAGLSFRVLDPDLAGASYYFVHPMPGRTFPDWSVYGQVLMEVGPDVLLRTTPERAAQASLAGAELQALTLTPKPLDLPSTEQIFPTAVTPDPLIQSMMDQVVQADVVEYDRQLAGELPVWVDGSWYTISTRYTYSGTPIQKTTSWIGQTWQALGLDVEYHVWGGSTYPNVIGEITGLTNPDDIFIVGGHVDDVQGTPGADDNASAAVAAMIAANILTQYQWGCTLRFAVWTGEEQGLNGSQAYAQRAYNNGENIVGYLNLDMIAYNTINSARGIDLLYNPGMPPTLQLAQLESDVIDAYNINLIPELVTGLGGGSDHSSFWDYGYTAILSIEDQDDFNPYYHGSGDTPAHTDPGYFTDFVKASIGTFAHMSGCLIPAGLGALDGHVTDASSGTPISGATLTMVDPLDHSFYTTTNGSGYYTRTLMANTYVVTATHPQYETASVSGVQVVTDTVTHQDFILTPRGRLWGYVTDLDNGFPLEATVSSEGLSAQSDPATGYYELYLDEGTHNVTASAPNYAPAAASVSLVSGQSTRHDFALAADISFIPKPVHVTVLLNDTDTAPAQLLNRKTTAYPFELYELPGGYLPPGLQTLWPGPDGYGYTGEVIDYDWVEISGSGTPVPGLSDDSYAGPFNVGFTFPYYGTNRTQFYLSSNGIISFGSGDNEWINECPLPNAGTPNNLIALLWDDLDPNYSTGGLYYQSFATCPVGPGACLIVEYRNWYHCCSGVVAGTFEAILFDNGSVEIQFQDGGSEQGSGSTTGTEGNNAPANHGLTYACNTANTIVDGLAMCYQHPDSSGCVAVDVPWVGESPMQGTVPAGGSLNLTLYFSATAGAGVTQPGDYYATLLVNGTPKIRVPVTMTVVTEMVAPMASFDSSSPGCTGTPVAFTNTSDLGVPPATDFLWTFGDGITSTLKNPTHLYAGPGTYTVTLEVCNPAGCDTAEGAVEVLAGPDAAFTWSADLLTVTFANASQNATAYLWAFGDGGTSTETNPVHTYVAAGTYAVTLTAYGCGEDVATAQVTVEALPEAGFESNAPICLGEPAVFTNTSVGADTYLWTLGDGGTSTETNPVHLYAAVGPYTVTLEACSEAGCDTVTGTVEVRPLPEAAFTFAADLLAVTFTNASQNATTYLWTFGDGGTSTETNPVHTYATAGTYTVTLAATGECGTAWFSAPVAVSLLPEAGFLSSAPVCLGTPVVFTNTSANADTYLWAFGDGLTSTLANPVHNYAAAGDYDVSLEACRSADCDTANATVQVMPLPAAGFAWVADLLTVTFINSSQNADAYLWAFGDGGTSTETNPVHSYAAAGTYPVTLTAAGGCGEDIAMNEVTVTTAPPTWNIYLPLVHKAGGR